jgi:hypothetical protein
MHGLACLFESPKNLGDQFVSGATWAVMFASFILNIHPEPKHLGHVEFHRHIPGSVTSLI